MELYGEDLTYIHEAGFGWFALRSAPGLLALLRKHGVDQGLVVDLGCGSGIWVRQLAFAGYSATGVDASPAMIRLARKTVRGPRFVCADIGHFDLPRCDAVTCIGEVLSYTGETRRVFRRVFRALRPGGVFVFDIAVPGRTPGGMKRKDWWGGDDWAVLLEAAEEHGVLTRSLITFRKRGASWRRGVEVHQLRLYDRDEIRTELEISGFEVTRLRGFGEVRFQSGHAGFLARKPT